MNFDYTYIILGRTIIFEPMTILTNMFIGLFCVWAFFKVLQFKTALSTQWSLFFLLIGLSSLIGSVAHGAHLQLGETFFSGTVFLMNAVSLIAIFFCFKAANTHFSMGRKSPGKLATYFVIAWIAILLVFTFIQGNFLLIKIHAGIVLTYSLIIHILTYRKGQPGSGHIAAGIIISFLSIIVHSLKLSIHEWFNYKDIAHVIMVISLIYIYKGVRLQLKKEGADVRGHMALS